MRNQRILIFSIILALIIAIIVHVMLMMVRFYNEKKYIRMEAISQALDLTQTANNMISKKEDDLELILKSGSIIDKGKLLSLMTSYKAGYLYSLSYMRETVLFGNALNNGTKQKLYIAWLTQKSPFVGNNYINLDNKIYLLKYMVDIHINENYLLVLQLDESHFLNLLANIDGDFNNDITIVSTGGHKIWQSADMKYDIDIKDYKEVVTKNNLDIYIMNETRSWIYIIHYMDIYKDILRNAFFKAFLLTLPLIFVFLGLIYLFSKIFYQRLQKIIMFLDKHIGKNPEKQIVKLMDIHAAYQQNLPKLQEQKILAFLKGENIDDKEEILNHIGLRHYFLLALLPNNIVLMSEFKKIIEECNLNTYIIRYDSNIIVIFSSNEQDQLRQLVKSFSFSSELIILSTIYTDILHMPSAYQELLISMYRAIKSDSNIICAGLMKKGDKNWISYSDHQRKNLFKSIKSNDHWQSVIMEILDDIFMANPQIINLKFILAKLFTELYQFSSAYNILTEENTMDTLYAQLLRLNNKKQCYTFFYDFCALIARHIEKVKKDDDLIVTDLIKNHIDENYHRIYFSVIYISEELGYSISYLERKFKQCYGISIKRYLTNKRIDVAKTMMQQDKNIKIKDIAINVGYANPKSFSAIFKKYEKVTPEEYRQNKIL